MLTDYKMQARNKRVRFWRQDKKWRCAEVCADPFAELPGRSQPWWKHYGLRGCGETVQAALADWHCWMQASEFVADIY